MDGPPLQIRPAIDAFGSCPHCGADLNGPRIWQAFSEDHGEKKADLWAPNYGATRDRGRFSRAIAETGTPPGVPTIYRCPDCGEDVSDAFKGLFAR